MSVDSTPDKPVEVDQQTSAIANYARRAALDKEIFKSRQIVRPVLGQHESNRLMKRSGLVVSFVISLIFAIIVQVGNMIVMPGSPISVSPFGLLGGTLFIIFFGLIVGFISVTSLRAQTRMMKFLIGVLIALLIWYIIRMGNLVAGMFLGTFVVMLLTGLIMTLVVLIIPYGLLVHWAARMQVLYFYKPWWHWRRLLVPILLLAVALLVGSRFIYTSAEQRAILTMGAIMDQSINAHSPQQLPKEIRNLSGTPFLPYARGAYKLTLSGHQFFPYQVNSDGTPRLEDFYVVATFESRYDLYCRFTHNGTMIDCWSDWEPPFSDRIG